jgi:hypothetical protein
LTVRVVAVLRLVGDAVSEAGAEVVVVSTVVVVVVSSGAGVGVGVGVTTGAGSVVTGCACCAPAGVDESARAAAIAGRALARA